jgi:DNA modification methylase
MSERVDLHDGRVTLYRGDCREILPTLGKVDAVVTDPPYGISDAPFKGQDRVGKRKGQSNGWHSESWWDASIDPEWVALCCDRADTVAWFGHWRKREEVERAAPFKLRAEIIWSKDCHVGPPCPVAMRDERIWLFAKDGISGKTFETSVWDHPIIPTWSHKHHKNEKPVGLMLRLVRFLGAGAVLDPFMGSGTTGVATVKAGGRFIGCEIDPGHFDIACRRIDDAAKQPDLFAEPAPKPSQVAFL